MSTRGDRAGRPDEAGPGEPASPPQVPVAPLSASAAAPGASPPPAAPGAAPGADAPATLHGVITRAIAVSTGLPEAAPPDPVLHLSIEVVATLRDAIVLDERLEHAIAQLREHRRLLRRIEREIGLDLAHRGTMVFKVPWSFQRTFVWPHQMTILGELLHWAHRHGPEHGRPLCGIDLASTEPVRVVGAAKRPGPGLSHCARCWTLVREAYRKLVADGSVV